VTSCDGVALDRLIPAPYLKIAGPVRGRDGVFQFVGIAPGRYRVTRSGAPEFSREVTVGEQDCELVLDRP
jgi:hypothetical protein